MQDLVFSLARHGFERVFVINGHGGNIATTKAAFAQAMARPPAETCRWLETSLSPVQLVQGGTGDATGP